MVGEGGLLNRQRGETRPHFAKEEASSHQDAHLPFTHGSVPSPRLSRLYALSIFDIIHGGFVWPEKTTSWHMRTWLVLWGWNCPRDDFSIDHQQTKANMERSRQKGRGTDGSLLAIRSYSEPPMTSTHPSKPLPEDHHPLVQQMFRKPTPCAQPLWQMGKTSQAEQPGVEGPQEPFLVASHHPRALSPQGVRSPRA